MVSVLRESDGRKLCYIYDLIFEVIQYCFYCSVFIEVFIKEVLFKFKGRGNKIYFLVEVEVAFWNSTWDQKYCCVYFWKMQLVLEFIVWECLESYMVVVLFFDDSWDFEGQIIFVIMV